MEQNNSNFLSYKLKRAFTIIEFLIVFGIIGIITTLSIASYNAFTESFKLKNEVQNAIAVLSVAQKRSVAGEDVSGDCPGGTFDSFVVSFAVNAGYSMQGQCINGAGTKTAYGSPVTYKIEASNKNIEILDTVTVTFSKLTGEPDSPKTIRFKNSVKDECMQINIAATGLISSIEIDCPVGP